MRGFLAGLLISLSVLGNTQNLTQVAASERKLQIHSVAYDLAFELSEAKTFKARATLNVRLRHVKSPLLIDFAAGTLERVSVNGSPLEDAKSKSNLISIPAGMLTRNK